jgi:hypothetical protein
MVHCMRVMKVQIMPRLRSLAGSMRDEEAYLETMGSCGPLAVEQVRGPTVHGDQVGFMETMGSADALVGVPVAFQDLAHVSATGSVLPPHMAGRATPVIPPNKMGPTLLQETLVAQPSFISIETNTLV